MDKLIIRKIEEGDMAELAAIEAESFSTPWSEQSFRELLSLDYAHYLVALYDGEIAGSAGMRVICDEGNIDNVVVKPTLRGKGIANELIAELIKLGDSMGVVAYTLEVRVSNASAIHIYEKNGFVNEGIRPRFYEKPVEDAMIMWRR